MTDYENYYGTHSRNFDRLRFDDQTEVEATVQRILTFLPSHTLRVLEIGCGTARHAALLGATSTTGLDLHHTQLLAAQERLGQLIEADAAALPLVSGGVDGVLAVMMIHQVEKRHRALLFSEVHRILAPGGRFIIKTASPDDIVRRPFADLFPSVSRFNLARYPTEDDLVAYSKVAGLPLALKQPVKTVETMDVSRLIAGMEGPGSTTFGLLSEEERARGIEQLRETTAGVERLQLEHFHTYFVFEQAR